MNIGNEKEVIERLRAEVSILDESIKKLSVFLEGAEFKKLPMAERHIMYLQKQSMLIYSSTVHARIALMLDRTN